MPPRGRRPRHDAVARRPAVYAGLLPHVGAAYPTSSPHTHYRRLLDYVLERLRLPRDRQ